MSIDKQQVYDFLLTIPQGKVVTYKQIAIYLGNPHLARVVGNILHQNPNPNQYPCYKVVNSKGALSPHFAFGGIEVQQTLLEADGITVKNHRVDLSIFQWQASNSP